MKRKCDKCSAPATTHSVEIIKGKKIEKHLCDQHAADEGLLAKSSHAPVNEWLNNLVKQHLGPSVKQQQRELACESCGMTFRQFRENSLLGCPLCYEAFETPLEPLLERAHQGGSHHVGKTPSHAGAAGADRQQQLMRMRKRLDEAVSVEDFELAVKLRDEIGRLEEQA